MIEWWGWNRDGFDRSYPEYYPPRDGSELLQSGIDALHEQGMNVALYFNGRLVDVTTKTFNNSKEFMTIDQNGRYYTETYHPYFTAAVACPATEWWKNTVLNFSLTAVRDYDVDMIYLDQISVASPKLCYSTTHGHTPSGGSWWWEELNELLELIRSEIRKFKPDAAISSENVNEVYIKYIDVFWSYDVHYDFQSWLPNGRSAPMFAFVYHGYTLQYGRTDAPPDIQSDMYLWSVSEALTRGYIGGVSTLMRPSRYGVTTHDVSFLSKAVETRESFEEFLVFGNMTSPLEFYVANYTFSENWEWTVRDVTRPSVAVEAYRAEDERIAIVLSNRVHWNETVQIYLNLTGLGINDQTVSATLHRIGADSTSGTYENGENISVEVLALSNFVLVLGALFPTDLNKDGIVNIIDISVVAMAFGSTPEDPNWNQIADLNNDQIINILDISTIAIDFGKTV